MARHLRSCLFLLDFLSINLLFFAGLNSLFTGMDSDKLLAFVLLSNVWWYFIAKFFTVYKNLTTRSSVKHYTLFAKALAVFLVVTLFRFSASFKYSIINSFYFYKEFFVYAAAISSAMIIGRILLFMYRRRERENLSKNFNTIIIGHNSFAESLKKTDFIESFGIFGAYNIHPNKLKNITENRIIAAKRLLKIDNLQNVILCDDAVDRVNFEEIMTIANRNMIRIYVIPDLKGVDLNTSRLVSFKGIPMIKSISEPLEEKENRIYKRTFDIVFSALVIVFILSWLYPLVALLVKITDPGPILFKQKRSGHLNRDFYCLKFRSMKVNGEADNKIASKNDSRVTALGAFLRKTSIDELPQFINVLIGDMSVVGPRPHMVSQTSKYSELVQKYMIRHYVKPGITGWAQVMGSRGEIRNDDDMEQRIQKDTWYIQNWSLMLDIKIVFLTLFNIVKGDKQAY